MFSPVAFLLEFRPEQGSRKTISRLRRAVGVASAAPDLEVLILRS
jgi:hypothetical protein